MLHKLELGKNDERVFELIYEGFIGIAKPATREEHAATKGVLKKLRALSVETESGDVIPGYNPKDPLSPKRRTLVPDSFELFDEAEWSYLTKTLDQVSTPAVVSDLVMEMFDRLDQAPKGDAKDLMPLYPVAG